MNRNLFFSKKKISDVISKFRFNLPANRTEIMHQLEYDNDEDVVVPRKKNECIEIGETFFYEMKKSKKEPKFLTYIELIEQS